MNVAEQRLACSGLDCGAVSARPYGAFAGPGERERPWAPTRVQAEGAGFLWEGDGLRLQVEVDPGVDTGLLRWSLEATEARRLDHLGLRLDLALLTVPAGLRWLRQGYASWTPTASLPWGWSPPRALSHSFAVANHAIDAVGWRRGRGMASHGHGVISAGSRGFLAGFLGAEVGLPELTPRPGADPFLAATLDFGGRGLEAGERLELEPLRLSWGPLHEIHARYLDEVARRAGLDLDALATRPAPSGWCSWYHFYTRVTDPDMVRNAEALRGLGELGLSVVQLDDGYQTAVGDWRSLNRKFPRGLGPVAADIRAWGYDPGLWIAPFMAGRRSRLYADHPDWILRDARGRPLDCGLNPAWMDRLVGLDLSHPQVQAWLHDLFRGLRDEGFRFFKLDFLYAALRRAAAHDPRRSPVERYRMGLRIIREAVGDGFILGCGAPILPSVGLVDGMRVSGDVKEQWAPGLLGLAGADCGAPSLRESARNNLTRAAMHRRWWLNDPDCLLVRDTDTALGPDEVQLLATVVALTGGLGLISDDLSAIPADRRALLARVLPPGPLRPEIPDLFERPFPEQAVLQGSRRRLVVLLNWERAAAERPLPDASVCRFDAWNLEPVLGPSLRVPGHGVRAFWETPCAEHPDLVGTDLHLTGLVDGRIEADFDGETTTVRRHLAPRAGRLWFALPAGWSLEAVEGPARLAGPWERGLILQIEASPDELRLRWRRLG